MYKKEKKKAFKQLKFLAILIIFSGLFFNILPGSSYFWYPFEKVASSISDKKITGSYFIAGKVINKVEGKRHFNGDGSSIYVYSIPHKLCSYYESPDSTFFNNYPKKTVGSDYEITNWQKTPIQKEHLSAFNFANDRTFLDFDFSFDEIINDPDNYYAFEAQYMSSYPNDHIMDCNFYIICPSKCLYIYINHNT